MKAPTPLAAVDSPASPPVSSSPASTPAASGPAAEKRVVLSPLDYAFQKLLQPLRKSLDQLSNDLAEFRREAMTLFERPPQAAAPAAIDDRAATKLVQQPAAGEPCLGDGMAREAWEEIILGSELCGDPSLSAIRRQFVDDVVGGGISARALAGQLLLLQATAVEELPERFRHVGEAYYRWRPRLSAADDPLERSLADWLTRRAESAGLRNSIQLVRPGDRFDAARHLSSTRGVEVVAVYGWIVLRDNQKVYTKASVGVQ